MKTRYKSVNVWYRNADHEKKPVKYVESSFTTMSEIVWRRAKRYRKKYSNR